MASSLTVLTYFESVFFFGFFKTSLGGNSVSSSTVFNPLHLNISMHILHTVLHAFPIGTDKENFPYERKLLLSLVLVTLLCD